jgi:hypothetical protein
MRGLSTMPTRPPSAPPGRCGRMRGTPGAVRRQPLHTATYPPPAAPAVRRHGFFGRLARRAVGVRPPLTADQQLRLLQLALNVKLKREGKPADAIRLTLAEQAPARPRRAPVRQGANRPVTPWSRATGAR